MNEVPNNTSKKHNTPTVCIKSIKEKISSHITSLLINPLDNRLETYIHTCDKLCILINQNEVPLQIKQQISSFITSTKEKITSFVNNIKEEISSLIPALPILYSLESLIISTMIYEKERIREKDMNNLRVIGFHIQTLTSLLQQLKISYKILGTVTNVIGDLIAYTPYPYSYLMGKDVLSYRIINRTQIPEICMLMASVGAFATYYFLLSGNTPEAFFVMAHNKAMFSLSQFTKTGNISQMIIYTKILLQSLLASSPKNTHGPNNPDA